MSRLRTAVASNIYGDSMFMLYANRANAPIHVIVERGRVELKGVVQSRLEKRRAELLARDVFGVFSVNNQLRLVSQTASQ